MECWSTVTQKLIKLTFLIIDSFKPSWHLSVIYLRNNPQDVVGNDRGRFELKQIRAGYFFLIMQAQTNLRLVENWF